MTDELVRRIVEQCEGMGDDEIIAAYYADYYDEAKPHVREALDQMGIDEHDVSAWVYRNIK